jgi:hypothetical protein
VAARLDQFALDLSGVDEDVNERAEALGESGL